jgi:hypothetical protein
MRVLVRGRDWGTVWYQVLPLVPLSSVPAHPTQVYISGSARPVTWLVIDGPPPDLLLTFSDYVITTFMLMTKAYITLCRRCSDQAGEVALVAVHPSDDYMTAAQMLMHMTKAYITLRCRSDQAGEVVSVAVHPSNDYMITASTDGTWCFYDVQAALCLTQVTNP